MSEEIPAILSESLPVPEPLAVGVGGSLRAARESQGVDVNEVARKLCLSPRQVIALEADDFSALPSPTFVRGFIRNYARFLQLPPEPLLAAYREIQPESASGNSSITLQSEEIPILAGDRKAWVPYLVASLLIGLAGGGWWAYMDWMDRQPPQQQPPVAQVAKPEPTPPVAVPTDSAAPEPAPVLPPTPEAVAAIAAPGPVTPPVAPTETQPAPVATPTVNQIAMNFSQQSWVRVTDRDGKEIFHKNSPAGTEDVVNGTPPFKLEVGNAAGVQLTYNGKPVDLAPHTKANVARLTLE